MSTHDNAASVLSSLILAVSICSVSSQNAAAQNSSSQLDQSIRTESNALDQVTKDLGPQMGQIDSMARQMGDPNLAQEMQQMNGSAPPAMGSDMMSQISALANQVSHIPGLGNICSALQLASNGASSQKQFCKPSTISKILPQFGGGAKASIANGGMMGDLSVISQLCGSQSVGSNPAVQSEMGQAAKVMPAAVKNMEQENQEIKQLLKE